MSKHDKNLFQSPLAITVSLYVYAFVVSIFFTFSLSTWLFGFVITRFGGKIEYFLTWLLTFAVVYAFDGLASIAARVKAITKADKPDESPELKAMSAWFLGFTALAIVTLLVSGFLAENLAFKAVKEASAKGYNMNIIKTANTGRKGVNAAEKLDQFLFSGAGTSIQITASLAQKNETFSYFLERKWTLGEVRAASDLIDANKNSIKSLKEIISASDYLQVLDYPVTRIKEMNRHTAYGYTLLEEYARQLALEAKLMSLTHREKEAYADVQAISRLFNLLRDDSSGLVTKAAAIKVQTVLSSAFAVLMQNDAAYRLVRPLMTAVIQNAKNGLTRSGLREETALMLEKYSLIKKDRAMLKSVTGLSGPVAALSTITGALDISFYRMITDFTDASGEINIRAYTDVKALPYWPYLFTKAMEPDLIKFYRDEAFSLANLNTLYVLSLMKDHALSGGKLPASMREASKFIPANILKDPFGKDTDLLIIYKGDYLEIYSVGSNYSDEAGSIADNRDLGHLLPLK